MKVKQKLSEYEPIKILTLAYLHNVVDPYFKMSGKKYKLYKGIIHNMLDAAYAEGVHTALDLHQHTKLKLMEVPGSPTFIKEALTLLEDSRKGDLNETEDI